MKEDKQMCLDAGMDDYLGKASVQRTISRGNRALEPSDFTTEEAIVARIVLQMTVRLIYKINGNSCTYSER